MNAACVRILARHRQGIRVEVLDIYGRIDWLYLAFGVHEGQVAFLGGSITLPPLSNFEAESFQFLLPLPFLFADVGR
jgi:hypothetical protein